MSEITTTNQEQAVQKQSTVSMMPAHIVTAMRLATTLAKSSLIPKALQGRPEDTLVVLLKGEELGLKPMQSLGSIDVIQGKARLSAELTVALVLKSGVCEYFDLVESTAKIATYCTKRRGSGRETTMSYTIDEAVIAGLAGKDNWKAYPAAMLRARASQALSRAVYPDLTLGLVTDDEAEEIKRDLSAALTEVHARPRTLDQLTERMQEQPAQIEAATIDTSEPAADQPKPEPATVEGPPPDAKPAKKPATKANGGRPLGW